MSEERKKLSSDPVQPKFNAPVLNIESQEIPVGHMIDFVRSDLLGGRDGIC